MLLGHVAEGRPGYTTVPPHILAGVKRLGCPVDVELHNLLNDDGRGTREVRLRRSLAKPMPKGSVVQESEKDLEGCPVLSERTFVELKGRPEEAGTLFLWDTGAMATLVTPVSLREMVKRGVKATPMSKNGYSLKAANGHAMEIDSIVCLKVRINKHTCSIPAIVCPDASCNILGMNAISFYNLEIDHLTSSVRVERQRPKGAVGEVRGMERAELYCKAAETTTIAARTGKAVKMVACDKDGNRAVGVRELVMDVATACVLVKTNREGVFTAPFTNHLYQSEVLKKDQMVAPLMHTDEYSFMGLEMATEVECSTTQRPRPHTEKEKKAVRGKLWDNVRRMTDSRYKERMSRLLNKYEDVFSVDKEDVGICDWIEHKIEPKDPKKVTYVKQFRLTQDDQQKLRDQVASWLKCGIIRRGRSPHNNPIFCVPKPGNRGVRVVCDMRMQNNNCRTDLYSVPSVDQILERVGRANATLFSSIDLSSGFYHIPLRKCDQQYAAFTLTNLGQFLFQRSIMGMSGAPATFSRAVDLMLGDLEAVVSYVDDILCFNRDIEDHMRCLEEVLKRLRKAGMRANAEKSVFGVTEINYLGTNITSAGVRPTLDRMEAMAKMKAPRTKKELSAVIGVFNYMSNYIFNYARKVEPLRRCSRPDEWGEGDLPPDARKAFDKIKKEISSRPVVCFVRDNLKLHLYVDFALGDHRGHGSGMGAVLLQERLDGDKEPVAYLSRALATSELSFPAELGEWRAIEWATGKLMHLLKHREFVIHSDHKAIINIQEKLGGHHKRILKQCKMHLLDLTPQWRYVKGCSNRIADFLSRYHNLNVRPDELAERAEKEECEAVRRKRTAESVALLTHAIESDELVDPNIHRIALLQKCDPRCVEICNDIREDVKGSTMTDPVLRPHKRARHDARVTIIKGVLMVRPPPLKGVIDRDPIKIWTPEGMVREVVNAYHTNHLTGHEGQDRTYRRIREHHWWPGITNDVRDGIKRCGVCSETTELNVAADAPLRVARPPTGINQRVNIDTFGPVTDSFNKGVYISVIVEAFSKHVTMKVMPDKTAESTAKALMEYIYVFGVPREVVTDNGQEYANELYTYLCKMLKIDKKHTSPMWPRCNGSAETFMKELQDKLRKHLVVAREEEVDFTSFLGPVALAHNTAINTRNRMSPHDVLLGYDPRLPLWSSYEDTFAAEPGNKSYADFVAQHAQRVLAARRLIYNNRTHAQEKYKERYELSREIDVPVYTPGQPVYARTWKNTYRKRSQKLEPKWEEAFILRRHNLSQFLIWRPGKTYNHGISRVNEAHLKPDLTKKRSPLDEDTLNGLLQGNEPSEEREAPDDDGESFVDEPGEDDDGTPPPPPQPGMDDEADGSDGNESDEAGDGDRDDSERRPDDDDGSQTSDGEPASDREDVQEGARRRKRKRQKGRRDAKVSKRAANKRPADPQPVAGPSKRPDATGRAPTAAGRKHRRDDDDEHPPAAPKRRDEGTGRPRAAGGKRRHTQEESGAAPAEKRQFPRDRAPAAAGAKRQASSQEPTSAPRRARTEAPATQPEDSGRGTTDLEEGWSLSLLAKVALAAVVAEEAAATLVFQPMPASSRKAARKAARAMMYRRRGLIRYLMRKGEANWTKEDRWKMERACNLGRFSGTADDGGAKEDGTTARPPTRPPQQVGLDGQHSGPPPVPAFGRGRGADGSAEEPRQTQQPEEESQNNALPPPQPEREHHNSDSEGEAAGRRKRGGTEWAAILYYLNKEKPAAERLGLGDDEQLNAIVKRRLRHEEEQRKRPERPADGGHEQKKRFVAKWVGQARKAMRRALLVK